MLTPDAALERATALIGHARKAGADAADAVFAGSSAESVTVRLGKLEDVERSESEHLDLRVFVGRGSASIGSSDLSDEALAELAERAVAMARSAPDDDYAGLGPDELLAHPPFPALDLADSADPGPAALQARARDCEAAAMAVAGVSNSEGGTASVAARVFALATSAGFGGAYAGTSHSLSASVIAGEGAAKQRDFAWRAARHLADLPSPAEIGALAGTRAAARVGAGRIASGAMPVVFDPRIGGTLLGHLLSAIAGSAIARKASFLLGREGERLFAPGIAVIDDPLRPRGLGSRPFDGEGLVCAPRALIEDGRLTGWLMDSASARQLGLQPTGHAARGGGGAPGISQSNLHLAPGAQTPAELIADIAQGVYVTELIGHGVSTVTGDYSRGAAGFRIEHGAIAGPVGEFTIAGNLSAMFAALTPADDLEWHRSVNVPTLRVDGMTVAGD